MFKSFTTYLLSTKTAIDFVQLNAQASQCPMIPCSPTEASRIGWVAPDAPMSERYIENAGPYQIMS
jgi:DNA recombination-dependent growth factor C